MDVPQKQIKKVVLTNLFGWDVVCYRLGDSIFIAGESEIAAINLNTKKLRYCSEEHLKAQYFPDSTISYCFYLNAQEFTEEAFLEDLETIQLQEYSIY